MLQKVVYELVKMKPRGRGK